MRFDDLKFEQRGHGLGIRATHTFPNGYGVSIIKTPYSYGGGMGYFEAAVLKNGKICYDTPITEDVLGWLRPDDINIFLDLVEHVHEMDDINYTEV